jgi:hypothetical protein
MDEVSCGYALDMWSTNRRHHNWGNGHNSPEGPDLSLRKEGHGRGLGLEDSLPVAERKDWEGCQRDLAGHSLVDWPWGREDERKKRVTLEEVFSGKNIRKDRRIAGAFCLRAGRDGG